MVMLELGSLLENYCASKSMLLLGFGAKWKGYHNNQVCFSFPLTKNTRKYHVHGIKKVIHNYKKSLDDCELLGPTIASPSLKDMLSVIKENQLEGNLKEYYIITMILDGDVEDETDFI